MTRLSLIKRKPKKTSLSALKKKAWKLCSLVIRQKKADHRGFVTCVSCGKVDHWKNMQTGHFMPKSLGLCFYFLEKNLNVQCETCNIWKKEAAMIRYTIYMQETYGPNIVEELEAYGRDNKGMKLYAADYEQMIEEYQSRLSVIERAQKWNLPYVPCYSDEEAV